MVTLKKSDAINIYKYLYHYQDLVRETSSFEDGDTLSQIHRQLHELIVKSPPDLEETGNRSETVCPSIFLTVPQFAAKSPAGDVCNMTFVSKTHDSCTEVVLLVSDDTGISMEIDGLRSLTLSENGKMLTLKTHDDDLHDFVLIKPHKQLLHLLKPGIENFLSNTAGQFKP